MIKVMEVSPHAQEVKKLISELDDYHNSIYPVGSHELDSVDELSKENVIFLAAFEEENAVACGAVKFLPEGYAELKRMYVSPKGRGKGLAKKIMEALESRVKIKNFNVVKLETGVHQVAAKNLYGSFGFKETTLFGNYTENPLSIFMEKRLSIEKTSS